MEFGSPDFVFCEKIVSGMTYTNRLGLECQEESRFCRRIVAELNPFGLTFVRKQGCLKMLAGHSR